MSVTESFITLNTDQVQGILYKNKTQIRQPIKGLLSHSYGKDKFGNMVIKQGDKWYDVKRFSPYLIGDIIYVKEAWSYLPVSHDDRLGDDTYYYRADDPDLRPKRFAGTKWKPNIHMPREAARLFLKITNIRGCRLHKITDQDKVSLGYNTDTVNIDEEYGINIWNTSLKPSEKEKYNWDENPFVFVYEFERVTELKHVGKYMLIP